MDQPSERGAHRDAAEERQQEHPADGRGGRGVRRGQGLHRDGVDDERRAVVDEALAPQRRHGPKRQEAAEGGGGRRVRGGDGGADHPRDRPGHTEGVDHHRDDPGRDDHEQRAVEQDAPDEAPHLPRRRGERLPVQQRRQEEQQHHLVGQGGAAQLGDRREREPAGDQHDRLRDPDAVGEHRTHQEGRAECDDEFETVHVLGSSVRARCQWPTIDCGRRPSRRTVRRCPRSEGRGERARKRGRSHGRWPKWGWC